MKVVVSKQVRDFVAALAPGPRRELRQAIRDLGRGKGDVKALEGALDAFWRLRLRDYRVILAYEGAATVACIFAERRGIIYEVFAEILASQLSGRS
jgi:mRNA-degrading endonuclease RelE of RelBE toxin-antitoxin system